MNREDAHPTRDELLVMAYVDDELADEPRALLQSRLAQEPELARQVAVYKKLEVLARQMAPPEPLDHEWQRLQAESLQRAGARLGWGFLVAGSLGLLVLLGIYVLASDWSVLHKCFSLAPVVGFTILLVMRSRQKRRLAPFDPYTEVRR